MATYTDIFIRDAFDDTGQIPYTGTYYWTSPDIVPQQLNVLTCQQLQSAYNGPDLGMNILAQQANNVYVRCCNLGSGNSSGTITLYATPSSLLMNPASWWNNPVGTVAISPSPLPGSSIGCGQSAIIYNAPTVPSGFHYCLIAIVQTPMNPVPQPIINSNSQFVNWVLNNPAVAYRNITIVNAGLPAYQQGAKFGNLDNMAETFFFMVQGQNWPNNTNVNIQCTDVGCTFNYTQAFGSAPQTVTTLQTVPGNFMGNVLITITPPPGVPAPATATANFTYGRVTTDEDEIDLRKHARIAAFHGVRGAHENAMFVIMGQCMMKCSGGGL